MNGQPSIDSLLAADQIERLANEVKVLRESVDELKTSLEWAIRNARLTVHFDEAATPSFLPPPPLWLFEIGDAVTLEYQGEQIVGEVVELNDGENSATVRLVASGTLVSIEQDQLTGVPNELLGHRPVSDETSSPSVPAGDSPAPAPTPGRLF